MRASGAAVAEGDEMKWFSRKKTEEKPKIEAPFEVVHHMVDGVLWSFAQRRGTRIDKDIVRSAVAQIELEREWKRKRRK